jgi:predicted metal-dependent peptidase
MGELGREICLFAIMKNIEEKISKVKSKLMIENPYFGTLASSLKFEKNDDIESFVSDGDRFEYNDDYIDSLDSDELSFAIANACMHQALSHKGRSKGKLGWLWQMASDYSINSLLVENQFILPQKVKYENRFDGKYVEEIYQILLSEIDDLTESENADNDPDRQSDKSENQEDKNIQKEEISKDELSNEEYERFLDMLHQKLQKQGDLPKGLDRLLDISFESKVSWRELLYRYVNTHAQSDYRFFPPNMKYLYLGFALPAIYGEHLNISIAIDTSASIDRVLLEKFLSQLDQILQIFPNYEIELIECDSKIQNISILYPTQPLKATLKGGGGTDFRSVFDHIERESFNTKFLIYFTDGEGVFPEYIPRVDTLWVMEKKVDIPFGEILELGG